mmetsp:Transcript_3738/g.5780  ORF Transcript_3738/g.5780 Transcript_3738/m.5780 type:complete len:306 (-) Transcript_3738:123-1040(-)
MEAGIGDAACSRSRSASRQPTRQPPLLCLLLGGPGSGKTLLGNGLKTAFPMLCHASGGELARLATADEYRHTSPLLNSISRQMSDKRRRRLAAKRLVDVVTSVLAEGMQSHRSLTGLIADGVRATDIESFQQALGGRVVCVLRMDCPRETMLKRLEGRGSRDGDERLGLSDTTDDEGRVDAYLQRVTAEDDALQAHFGTLAYSTVFTSIDGTQTPEACLQAAQCALHRAAQAAGEPYSRALERIQDECTASLNVDWGAQMRATVARLDNEMHPDGRPRTHCEQSSMVLATDMRSNRDAALHGEKV